MPELDFYRAQSTATDPGGVGALPTDPRALAHLVSTLVVHRDATALFGFDLPARRREEAETRYAADMLALLRGTSAAPLTAGRAPSERFAGTCRDFAVLLCALLRHTGTPARVRCGFATYFQPGFHDDHWVTEYWQDGWRIADAELLVPEVAPGLDLRCDPLDLPPGAFIPGGGAWRACRSGAADPATFGVRVIDLTGMEIVQGNVVRDLAALNSVEVLPWDEWGVAAASLASLDPDAVAVLDWAAALGEAGGPFEALRTLYQNTPGLRVQGEVTSYTTHGGPRTVPVRS